MREEKSISDNRRNYGAADHDEHQNGILLLVDDIVRQAEQRRDRAEGESRRHEQRRVDSFLLSVFVRLGCGINAYDLRIHL